MKIKKTLTYSLPVTGLMLFVLLMQPEKLSADRLDSLHLDPYTNLSTEQIQPIPRGLKLAPGIVELGERLFEDPRMSENGLRCINCHNTSLSGNDGLKAPLYIHSENNQMNTPTIFNVSLNPLLTWYGRLMTLEQHLEMTLSDVKHMKGNWDNILLRLAEDPFYKERFRQLFYDGMTRENIKHAIVTFERSLTTPDSPFDNYLRGDNNAISKQQKQGFSLFKQYGCIACHQGINIGGNVHARLGTFLSPYAAENNDTATDMYSNLGRYNITGNVNDKYVFRVPSLRNVASTAPYFHGGEVSSLVVAVKFMARHQLGHEIDDKDARLITDFLGSLTGRYKGRSL